MKVKYLMCLVAAATAMTFVSCGKDPEPDPTPVDAEANTLVYGGKTYQLQSHYEISTEDRSYANAETVERDANGEALYFIRADVDASGLNRTMDLTQAYADASYAFGVNNAEYTFSIGQDMHGETPYGGINDRNYDNGGPFESGTITIKRTDNLFTYKVTGVLKNGENISFHLSVPSSDWMELDW